MGIYFLSGQSCLSLPLSPRLRRRGGSAVQEGKLYCNNANVGLPRPGLLSLPARLILPKIRAKRPKKPNSGLPVPADQPLRSLRLALRS